MGADGEIDKRAKPAKVTLGDSVNMKRVLDDAVVKAFMDAADVEDDRRLGNAKLVLMTVACAVALLGQFFPLPFPDNRGVLFVCAALYFVMSGVLQLVTWFVERDYVFASLPVSRRADSVRAPVYLRSALPRHAELYTVTLEWGGAAAGSGGPAALIAELRASVGRYFSSRGELDEAAVAADVCSVLAAPLLALTAAPAAATASGSEDSPVAPAAAAGGEARGSADGKGAARRRQRSAQ